MYYGIYKNIREGAWQCLVDFEICTLPIDILKIAKTCNIRVVRNSSLNILSEGEKGKSFFDGDSWIIIYDDESPTENARFTIAHELGHIFLGHETTHAKYLGAKEFKNKPVNEKQADMFALRLLCPACVIWGLDLRTANDIAAYCRVDQKVAAERHRRMKELYKRNKFLTSPMEKELYGNFKEYIKAENISKNGNG